MKAGRTQGEMKRKTWDQTSFFLPKLLLRVVSPPVLDFALPVPLLLLTFLLKNQGIVRIRSCKSSEKNSTQQLGSPDSNWVSLLCSIPSHSRSGVADYVIFLDHII
jgi:hypothetical protein